MSLARSCDVIVIGGGAAGTGAAVGAGNAGAQTLLGEAGPFLGGAATLKNVLTYCGLFTNYQKKQAVFGVADQVLRCLRAPNSSPCFMRCWKPLEGTTDCRCMLSPSACPRHRLTPCAEARGQGTKEN